MAEQCPRDKEALPLKLFTPVGVNDLALEAA